MKVLFSLSWLLIASFSASANDDVVDLHTLAQSYFDKMVATQAPNASKEDLEQFLSLMTDDVGSTHLPYVTDDARLPSGKNDMREGMMFYLGAHTEYTAEVLNIFTFNQTAIAIRYKNHAKGIHPQSKQPIEYTRTLLDVLEVENGKIAVIRKYHE
ncbi:nuclear transport factor 2 family protein [Alteromonas facilis]|uniref:nuclear transport factor 2 family protein n=1 Tax=Alteromonas facilis TaxID=2048004 RepID=UPI000C28FFA7|nr:nuclear transport factor 2 family protein [Alteromonas facilis]